MDNEHFESKNNKCLEQQFLTQNCDYCLEKRFLFKIVFLTQNENNKSDFKPRKQLLGSNGRNFLLTYYSYLKNIKLTSAKHRSFPKIKIAIFSWSDMKLIRFRYCKIFIKLPFRNSKLNSKVCAFEIIS